MKNRKSTKIIFILLIVFISVGFAYLTTNLNINGILNAKGNSWNIYFDNIQVSQGSVALSQNDTYPTISNDKLTVNYSVTLSMPGDYYEFTVDVVNDGTLDAVIDFDRRTNLRRPESYYLYYGITYLDDEIPSYYDYLDRNTTETYKVRIEYLRDIDEEDLPDSDQTIELFFTCTYSKAETHNFSTLINGSDLNDRIELLAGDKSNVTAIKKANSLSITPTDDNLVSTSNSKYPIYMWYQNGDLYWYCEGDNVRVGSGYKMFKGLSNLTNISSISEWSLKKIYSIEEMFSGCSSLSNFSAISGWDISSAEHISSMFENCTSLTNLNFLSNWDVSNGPSVYSLFSGCTNLSNIDGISNWNVSHITNFSYMFQGCSSLTDVDALSNWETYNIRGMISTFKNCTSLSDLSGLENWDTSRCRQFKNTFEGCTSLTNVSYLSDWDFSAIYSMEYMFYGCTTLSNVSALNNWNLNNITDENVFGNTAVTVYPTWYVV